MYETETVSATQDLSQFMADFFATRILTGQDSDNPSQRPSFGRPIMRSPDRVENLAKRPIWVCFTKREESGVLVDLVAGTDESKHWGREQAREVGVIHEILRQY